MSLFDFKFEKLIAQKVLRGLYIFYVVIFSLAGIVALFGLSTADQPVWGLLIIVTGYILLLVTSRVAFESIMIRFQMAEDVRALRKRYVDNSSN
jgi:hypothetical protein